MELAFIGLTAFIVSGATLFSGFGLGTILMPAFALFFPLPLAITATAIVHFTNNILKFFLMAKLADWYVVARFSIPAAVAAMVGAIFLTHLGQLPVLASYNLGSSHHEITTIKIIIGSLILISALVELWPRFQQKIVIPLKWLPLGGLLSGFIGGLSGNQGALRSAFLIKAGLSKEAFISTSIVSAVIVDITRLFVYGTSFFQSYLVLSQGKLLLSITVGIGCAFLGSLGGIYFMQKVTFRVVQIVVTGLLLIVGMGLISGLL
ncbi:MAG: TSUP family transporter [Alphaproteobacteria bacterium]|nr:TSUP family transporter [Alphaproteobacteria bacterium]